jgi:hypothetical protein
LAEKFAAKLLFKKVPGLLPDGLDPHPPWVKVLKPGQEVWANAAVAAKRTNTTAASERTRKRVIIVFG